MTEKSETHEHAEHALEEMEERNESLGEAIQGAKEDWESKKDDDQVPGAAGRQEDARSDDAPEADYPTKGPSE